MCDWHRRVGVGLTKVLLTPAQPLPASHQLTLYTMVVLPSLGSFYTDYLKYSFVSIGTDLHD